MSKITLSLAILSDQRSMNEDDVILIVFAVIPIILSTIFVFKAKSTPARILTALFVICTMISCYFVMFMFSFKRLL